MDDPHSCSTLHQYRQLLKVCGIYTPELCTRSNECRAFIGSKRFGTEFAPLYLHFHHSMVNRPRIRVADIHPAITIYLSSRMLIPYIAAYCKNNMWADLVSCHLSLLFGDCMDTATFVREHYILHICTL